MIAIFLVFIFQLFITMPVNDTEHQKYRVVKEYQDFEIRFYPSATLATINSDARTYKDLSGPGFRKLALYIFGGNKDKQKISMTAPVHMEVNNSNSKMSFVMPSSYKLENLPQPNDPNIIISQTKDEYTAAIKFGGYASDKDIKFYSEKLQNLLKQHSIPVIGNFKVLGYNPPYQIINRRNEIVVIVQWKE